MKIKRICSLALFLLVSLFLTACGGTYAQVNLNDPIPVGENGIIEKEVLDQIKAENAIGIFTGESGDFHYEWTVFGSDLSDTKDVNLSLALEKTTKGIKITFPEAQELGFPALLSIHLNEKWVEDSATAYEENVALCPVSITGSKVSILNLSLNRLMPECEIIPDSADVDSVSSGVGNDSEDGNGSGADAIKDGESIKADNAMQNDGDIQADNTIPQDGNENQTDEYLSGITIADNRVYSQGDATNQDQYKTDPVPEGKPLPVEPENQQINDNKTYTCTISIECATILNNLDKLDPDKRELIPSNGVILEPLLVTFYEGESVFDVLSRVCREKGIHMESSWTPVYNSAYIEGIHNLYEFDCGELSGWMYRVNGWYPNYGCSRYQLADGEKIEWRYTCDLGKDVGCDWME